jgi:serine/threonine protein kinase
MALLPPTESSQAWMSSLISAATSSARGTRGNPANLAAYLAVSTRMPIFKEEQLERLEILASGTTFKAYKCRDIKSGAVVVVKQLLGISRRPISNQPSTIDSSVLQELQIASYPPLLKCKNIILTLGFQHDEFTGSPLVSLVVEYSDIGTLQQYLASAFGTPAALDWALKRKLAVDIASGLKVIHQCRIIHGDLKPDNILIFPCDEKESKYPVIAKISDFGSSVIESVDEAEEFSTNRRGYHGTPLWVPPIVRKSLRVSFEMMPRCDVFSFGLIVWTIYKGETYFESSWKSLGQSDIEFLDVIEASGLLQRFGAYLAKVQDKMPLEEIRVLEQVVGGALNDDCLGKGLAQNVFIRREETVKTAFESIQKSVNVLARDETAGNR